MIGYEITNEGDTTMTNWNESHTLGGKGKPFKWKLVQDLGLIINREFKSGSRTDQLTIKDVEKIIQYVADKEKVALANSVEKLGNGTEKDGLGKFIYDNIKAETSLAQVSSQIASIFVEKGIFSYNGKERNMEFWIKNIDLIERLSK